MRKVFIIIIVISLLVNACSNKSGNNGTEQKVFTQEELKKYDGKNGNPAYVAVNGVVYDVSNSNLWSNGLHNKCSNSTYAGADLTNVFSESPHGTDIFKNFPVVGSLSK